MTPAHERLEPDDSLAGELDERLIVQPELAPRKSLLKIGAELMPVFRADDHRLLEELELSPALPLRVVECEVGAPQELIDRSDAFRREGDADAYSGLNRTGVDRVRTAEFRNVARRQCLSLERLIPTELDDNELVASGSRHQIPFADAFL